MSSSFASESAALSPLPVRPGATSSSRKGRARLRATRPPRAGAGCLPRLFCVPCLLARLSSRWMRPSRYSCFLPSISSVSRSRARASWALGAARLLEEPPPLKNLPNLLIVVRGRAVVRGARGSGLRTRRGAGERLRPGLGQAREAAPRVRTPSGAGDSLSRAFPGGRPAPLAGRGGHRRRTRPAPPGPRASGGKSWKGRRGHSPGPLHPGWDSPGASDRPDAGSEKRRPLSGV